MLEASRKQPDKKAGPQEHPGVKATEQYFAWQAQGRRMMIPRLKKSSA